MFKGTYRYKIDPKGRVAVPPSFRRSLGKDAEALVVTPLDQCLAVYTVSEWDRLREQLEALPAFSKRTLTLMRLLASRAADVSLDIQGRILVPPALRAPLGLVREVVIVGVLSRFEIWSVEAWNAFVRESEHLLDQMTSEVGLGGL